VVLLACGALVLAQERPTFRSAARTVYIYATVQDKDGRLVTNLTRDDFEIFDNGQPQAVTVFENDPQKITMAPWTRNCGRAGAPRSGTRRSSPAAVPRS
jgi:hypothetical protein